MAKVREGRLTPPTGRDFSPSEWTAERSVFKADAEDDALHATGLWLHAALAARWQRIEHLGYSALNPAFTYQLIALAANKDELAISAQLDAAVAEFKPDTPFYGIAALRLGDRDGEAATADMRRTGLIDTLGKAVAMAGTAFQSDQPSFGVDEMREALDNFRDIYLLEFLWGRVLWLGWSLGAEESPFRFAAPDPDHFARAMADYTGQRLGDVVAAVPSQYDGVELLVRQSKTNELLPITIARPLKLALDNRPFPNARRILVKENGEPYASESSFANALKREIKRLCLDSALSFHGLRYAAAARLEESGCTLGMICSIVGHRTYQMAVQYATKRRSSQAAAQVFETFGALPDTR